MIERRPASVCTALIVRVAGVAGLVDEEEFDIRKEAAYALCNACTGGSQQTLSGLVYHGVIAR